MSVKFLKGFISDESTRLAISAYQKRKEVHPENSWGRVSNDIDFVRNFIEDGFPESSKFHSLAFSAASEHFSPTALPSYWKWVKYSPWYGRPNVPPHIDLNACTYTIDIQLCGTVKWDLYIEGNPYTMEDGDAVLYLGNDNFHWRPKFPTNNPNDYLEMCFLHFVEPGHWYLENGPKWIDTEEVRIPWRNKMNELLPKFKHETYQPFSDPDEFPGY